MKSSELIRLLKRDGWVLTGGQESNKNNHEKNKNNR